MSTRRRWLLLIVVLLVVAVVGIGFMTLRGSRETPATDATAPRVAEGSFALPDAKRFERILNGVNKAEQATLLIPEARSADWSAEQVVPQGSKLVIDQKSFVSSGSYGAWQAWFEVEANHSILKRFIIHLQYQNGQWLIWTFEEVEQ